MLLNRLVFCFLPLTIFWQLYKAVCITSTCFKRLLSFSSQKSGCCYETLKNNAINKSLNVLIKARHNGRYRSRRRNQYTTQKMVGSCLPFLLSFHLTHFQFKLTTPLPNSLQHKQSKEVLTCTLVLMEAPHRYSTSMKDLQTKILSPGCQVQSQQILRPTVLSSFF